MSTDDDYPTDVTDEPWELLQPLLPKRTWRPSGPGRPPCDVRRRLNGILSLNQTGCQGRLVPTDFGHWSTIYGDCTRWRRDGVWARVLATLRQGERRYLGRQPEPATGSMDAQRIKTATQREELGFDGNNKIKARKRPILVDTLGLSMAVVVTSADTDDRLGLVEVLRQYVADGVKRRRNIWVDGAYPAEWLEEWVRGVKQTHTIDFEATTNKEGKGVHAMPWRWAVERTFAWLLKDRRHRRDDEQLTANSAAMIQISMIRLLLNRWA
jgi:putative transposase